MGINGIIVYIGSHPLNSVRALMYTLQNSDLEVNWQLSNMWMAIAVHVYGNCRIRV